MTEAPERPLLHDAPVEFDEAYRDYAPAMLAYARSLTPRRELAEDWVAEAFVRTIAATRRGRGPTSDVRGYLFAAVRSIRAESYRATVTYIHGAELPENHPDLVVEDQAQSVVNASVAASAFATLPARWRQVLHLTTVQDSPVEAAAEELGISAGAATVLAFRAREGLRTAYLQEWVPDAQCPDCAEPRPLLARWVRGQLPPAQTKMVDAHLEECDDCDAAVAALRGEAQRMRALPIWVLVPGAAPVLSAASAGGSAVGSATGPDLAWSLGRLAQQSHVSRWGWAAGTSAACLLTLGVSGAPYVPVGPAPAAAPALYSDVVADPRVGRDYTLISTESTTPVALATRVTSKASTAAAARVNPAPTPAPTPASAQAPAPAGPSTRQVGQTPAPAPPSTSPVGHGETASAASGSEPGTAVAPPATTPPPAPGSSAPQTSGTPEDVTTPTPRDAVKPRKKARGPAAIPESACVAFNRPDKVWATTTSGPQAQLRLCR